MSYTYNDSNVDGTIGDAITSGTVGALFTTLTAQERVAGDQEFSKVWITSSASLTAYIGITEPSPYSSNVFVSASDSDAVGDLTGSEDRYGALEVVSCIATLLVVNNNADYTLARVGDTIIVDGSAYEIDTVTDNGDDTSDIEATIDFVSLPSADDWVSTVFSLALTASTAKPFWREEKVVAGASWYGEYATCDILIAD